MIGKIRYIYNRIINSDTFLFLTNFYEKDKKNYFYFLFLPLATIVILFIINKWWVISLALIFFVYIVFVNADSIEEFIDDLRVYKTSQKYERMAEENVIDNMKLFGINIKLEKLLDSIIELEKMLHRVSMTDEARENLWKSTII